MGVRRFVGAGLAAVSVAVGAATLAPAAPAAVEQTNAQHLSGPYAVGSRHLTFDDSSRTTPTNGSYPGAPTRTLPTLVLYPAGGDPSGPAVENRTPLSRHDGYRFPLIVFSHGLGASGPAYSFLLQRFARAGYVVAAPTFPLSSAGAPGGVTLADYAKQPGDVSFVISSMVGLPHRDPLRRSIRRNRVGVGGHSLGGITTLGVETNSCCVDPRIDVAVSWSGAQLPFAGGSFYSVPTPPLLLIHGDQDGTVPYQASVNAYAGAPAPKAFVTLLGGPHVPFFPPWLEPTVRSTIDFFDRYLKRDRGALTRLRADANVAGASSLQEALGR